MTAVGQDSTTDRSELPSVNHTSGNSAPKNDTDAISSAETPTAESVNDTTGVANAADHGESSQSVGQYLVDRLVSEGNVRYLFGVPGGAINGFYKSVKVDGRITPILNAHETGAVFAAYGYARAGGGLGAVAVTSGPGTTNAITGIAAAHCDSVPVVLLSAQTAITGRNGTQDSSQWGLDTVAMLTPVTRLSAAINDSFSGVDIIDRGLRAALTGRRGPVHLALAPPVPFMPLPERRRPLPISVMRPVDVSAVERAAAVISASDRVVVIAGHGVEVSGATDALRRLAEEHGLAVANTPKGRVFSERHPLSLGVFGMGGHRRADEFVAAADVVVVVGSGFADVVNGFQPLRDDQRVVRTDIDPQVLAVNLDPEVSILGDARAVLTHLGEALHRHPRKRRASDVAASIARLPRDEPAPQGEGSPIHPSALVAAMSEVLPHDTILVPDVGNSTGQVTHYWSAEPGCFISALGLASMACALGVATGVRLAKPHQPVVVVVGDGAFTMNPGELHTQSEHKIKVITVVVNDSGFGMIDHFDQVFFGESTSPARFADPIDAALVAEGFGVRGLRASTIAEFRTALGTALRHNGPCLIDATVDPTPLTPISPRFMPPTRPTAVGRE